MESNSYTDPLSSLNENFINKTKEVLTGVKHGDVLPPDESMPIVVNLPQLVEDYNKADVDTQIKFVQLLVNHDFEKVQEALTKRKM